MFVSLYLLNFMFKTKLLIYFVCVWEGEKWFLEEVITKINKRTFVNNFNKK